MHPFRIAILIFLLGATVANFFEYARAVATISPYNTEMFTSHARAEVLDSALMREAIIITIAGVAWCLVRPSAAKRTEPLGHMENPG